LACETGIAPSALLQESERMLFTMQMYLKGKAEQMRQ